MMSSFFPFLPTLADRFPSYNTTVQTAMALLKRVRLDGLTTRRLADELGVKSPALYWHFRSKQELLDAMADTLIREAGMGPPRSGETWQQWLAVACGPIEHPC